MLLVAIFASLFAICSCKIDKIELEVSNFDSYNGQTCLSRVHITSFLVLSCTKIFFLAMILQCLPNR